MPKEILSYLSILSIEIDVTSSLSPEREIKEYAAPQKAGKNVVGRLARLLISKNAMVFCGLRDACRICQHLKICNVL